MRFEPIFSQVLWQFLSSGFRFGIFDQTLATCGGEMRPNYFKNSPPNRKLQARGSRLLLAISCMVDLARIELAPRQCE